MTYELLTNELRNRGMSKMKLAFEANINPPDLYCAINGKKPMYPNYRKRIAEALNMTEAELFEDATEVK